MADASTLSSMVKVRSKPPRLYSLFIQSGVGNPSGGVYETVSSFPFDLH
jgi:hypothetical protein